MSNLITACVGDMHVCPIPGHGSSPILPNGSSILVEGKPIARVGDAHVWNGNDMLLAPESNALLKQRYIHHSDHYLGGAAIPLQAHQQWSSLYSPEQGTVD